MVVLQFGGISNYITTKTGEWEVKKCRTISSLYSANQTTASSISLKGVGMGI